MSELTIKYNDLTAQQFIELWETVWGPGLTLEQTELAMQHTLFRVSIWEDDKIIAIENDKENKNQSISTAKRNNTKFRVHEYV